MKISYDLGFFYNRSCHGNVMTPLRFLFIFCVSLYQEFFFKKSLKGVPAIIASIMAKFEQILLNPSFKNHKTVK